MSTLTHINVNAPRRDVRCKMRLPRVRIVISRQITGDDLMMTKIIVIDYVCQTFLKKIRISQPFNKQKIYIFFSHPNRYIN